MDMIPATSLVCQQKLKLTGQKKLTILHIKSNKQNIWYESPKTPKSFDNNKMYISATDIIENTNR